MSDIKDQFTEVWNSLVAADAFGSARHTITFSIQGSATYDPATGRTTGGSPVDHTALGFFTQFKRDEFKSWEAGDTVFIVNQDELGYRPKINDRPTIGGNTYNVVDLSDDKAGGDGRTGVAYRILLRGG